MMCLRDFKKTPLFLGRWVWMKGRLAHIGPLSCYHMLMLREDTKRALASLREPSDDPDTWALTGLASACALFLRRFGRPVYDSPTDVLDDLSGRELNALCSRYVALYLTQEGDKTHV